MQFSNLRQLVGRWTDIKGSTYEVDLDAGERSCSVKTTRKDGVVRYTKGLVQLREDHIYWGQNYELQTSPGSSSIKWVSKNRRGFDWKRVETNKGLQTTKGGISSSQRIHPAGASKFTKAESFGSDASTASCLTPAELSPFQWNVAATSFVRESCPQLPPLAQLHLPDDELKSEENHVCHAPLDVVCSSVTAASLLLEVPPLPSEVLCQQGASCHLNDDCTNSYANDDSSSFAVGDAVYGYFYGEWHPGMVRKINADDDGSICVLWDSEFSISVLAQNCVVHRTIVAQQEPSRCEEAKAECMGGNVLSRTIVAQQEPSTVSAATAASTAKDVFEFCGKEAGDDGE